MATLGVYPKEFLEIESLWKESYKRLKRLAIDTGAKPEKNLFMAGGSGSRQTAMNAYLGLLMHDYDGDPIEPRIVVEAFKIMLKDRFAMARTEGRFQLAMIGTELNKPSFTDYIELAYQAAMESRQSPIPIEN